MEEKNIYGMEYKKLTDRYVNKKNFGCDLRLVQDFIGKRKRESISDNRTYKYVRVLKAWGEIFNKPFKKLTKKDVIQGVQQLDSSNYTQSYKTSLRVILRVFFREMFGNGTEPDETKWIKTPKKIFNHVPPHQLLGLEDVLTLCKAAYKPAYDVPWFPEQMQAALMLHFESGGRIGETLNLKIQDIELIKENYKNKMVEFCALHLPANKTSQPRTVYVIESFPYLKDWLKLHPKKNHYSSSLWINQREGNMSYNTFCTTIRRIADVAGITKPLNTHHFRKSRLSYLAKLGWSESQLSKQAGWIMGSQMARVYIHLASNDLRDKILDDYLEKKEKKN
jgi:integrase